MAWYNFWRKQEESKQEQRSIVNYNGNDDGWEALAFSVQKSESGVSVTENNAMENTAVGAAIRILSEDVGSLPLFLYKRLANGGRTVAREHPLYSVLHDSPNPFMTSIVFKETLMGHLLTWGNAYAEIEWDAKGQIKALWPLRPDRVSPFYDEQSKSLKYIVTIKNERLGLDHLRVLHLKGFGTDGFVGLSPIRLHREAIGLAKATEKYGSKYFGNGAKPGGVLEHPGQLSETSQKNLRKSWNEMHSGLENAHRIAILEEGMTYKQTGLPPEDSQFLETRKFQIEEVARIYRVPLHKLAAMDRSTFNNIEHQSIEYVTHSLRPYLIRWEQEIHLKCLLPSEKAKYYSEHKIDALLRGDYKTRMEGYQIALQNGLYNRNEIRIKENENPIGGEVGEVYTINSASVPIENMLRGGETDEGQATQSGEQGTEVHDDESGTEGEE